MKKGLAVLLVLVMSMGMLVAAMEPFAPSAEMSDQVALAPVSTPTQEEDAAFTPAASPETTEDPMIEYLKGLDPNGPRPPLRDLPAVDKEIVIPTNTDCILLFENPNEEDDWLPLPTESDIRNGLMEPVSFENGTQHEIHGKLFERIIETNETTYFDDIGIPDVPIDVTFAGVPVAMGNPNTGNNTTIISPFGDHGNGTFQFLLDINQPAGEYELVVTFHGWPTSGTVIYKELTYKAIVYVSHPSLIKVDVSPDNVVVGNSITVSGNMVDDTGVPIIDASLQIRFDNVLLGPTRAGMYLDDVRVDGADFFDDFEEEESEETKWNTYTAPGRGVGNQWERGSPSGTVGPLAPYSGSTLWGTNLDGNYARGAWSFLVTPKLNFTADQEYTLSFWAWWTMFWKKDYCYLIASLDGGNTWDDENRMYFMGDETTKITWTYYEFNVTRYVGSDNVKFAFVFYTEDITLDVRTDSSYAYQHQIPMSATADKHRITVFFKGNPYFRTGHSFKEIVVKRITHFEFETNETLKVGHRNNAVKLVAWLKDNMGEVPSTNIRGIPYIYQVAIYWDPTWTDPDDDPGDPAGPPRTMNRDSGEVSVNYVVRWDQELGPANVTFKFAGSDFYTKAEMKDIYHVKAEVYVDLPEKEELRGFRGQTLNIHGWLRVLPDQSIDDQQVGDPVDGEFIKLAWNNQPIGTRRTEIDGLFELEYIVPSTHELGDVLVTFVYEGQSLFEAINEYANYTIVSETFITLEDQKVHKGTWVYINGTIKDDKDQPVANMPIYIIWKRAPEIGRATSKTDGTFSLQYYIEFEDKVGNISVIARFKGTKIYLTNETTATYTVKVYTILERRDHNVNLVRGEQVQISGKLYEDWGGYRGVEVQRELISLLIDEILVNQKRTAFDGSVTFTAPIDPKIFTYGEKPLVLDFNGTDFYEASRNETKVVIKANSVLTFTEIRVEGELFDWKEDKVKRLEEIYGRVLLQDDNFQPIASGNVSVYYKDEGLRARKRLIKTGITDSQGFFEFNWTFKTRTTGGKLLIAEYEGLEVDTFLKAGDLVILPSEGTYPEAGGAGNETYFQFVVPEDEEPKFPLWAYILIFVVVLVGVIIIVYSSFYYRRRRQLRRMQRIIRRAADRLVAGNVYAATIFRAYREMAHTLRAYGQLRRDSETFREFENAVRDALPIDKDNLDDFLTVLEEARYSEHEIGESEKDRAIEALRAVQHSIERILLTEDQAAVIRSRVGELGDVVEPEIIVAEETARALEQAAAEEAARREQPPPEGEGDTAVEEQPRQEE